MTEKRTGEQDGAYWVNTVSLEHVQAGVEGGFTQADHGRATRLRRLRPGDGLVGDLDFVADPRRWGYPFRRGLFEIGRADFLRISGALGIDWDAHCNGRSG
jgi:hypothetical protein